MSRPNRYTKIPVDGNLETIKFRAYTYDNGKNKGIELRSGADVLALVESDSMSWSELHYAAVNTLRGVLEKLMECDPGNMGYRAEKD